MLGEEEAAASCARFVLASIQLVGNLLTEHILAKPMRKLKHSHLKTADLIVPTDTMPDGYGLSCRLLTNA